MPYNSVAEIRTANAASGKYWFSPDTLRFFSSIVYDDTLIAGRYFVTSEQRDDQPRLFTVRVANDDADISTVGEFQEHHTKAAAIAAAIREARSPSRTG